MGFFDKLLQGLGFEGEEEEPKKAKPKKEKVAQTARGQYVLSNKEETAVEKPTQRFYDVAPKSQEEVQMAVDFLKNGQSVRIDFTALPESAVFRAMDFVQGSAYALGIVPQKLAEKVFMLSVKK